MGLKKYNINNKRHVNIVFQNKSKKLMSHNSEKKNLTSFDKSYSANIFLINLISTEKLKSFLNQIRTLSRLVQIIHTLLNWF